ncbi:Sigma factor SigB regulation protein RsbQ [Kordia antarctica]|uniref:Sigma factor SigB regulation protein RsbQ n=1 Tax=Kordia antarctica TaxID=1218801 RepID=A0A7L4ZEG4_9FLAO|nr:alpha/beta hydrolase [Kordia antarctica]QHI35132.1 Sigma factor SigB regulation protein RsbQ [Kordia antarctica]
MDILKRNNVKVLGQGKKTMLFAHGFGCDQNMWRYVTPAFEEDFKIVLFDYVGCGKSDLSAYQPERYSQLQGYAQDVIDICNDLQLEDVIFVGHSVSCMIGVLAAIEKPNIFSHLILIGPSARYVNDIDYLGGFSREDLEGLLEVMDNNYLGWAAYLAPVVMKNDDKPELTKELQDSFCSTDPIITRKFAEVTFFSDNREDLSNLSKPCLVMQCSDDAIAPDTVGQYIHEQIQNSTFEKMKATGHCPHLSHPEETIIIIKNYLKTHAY